MTSYNESLRESVAIYFEEPSITALFAELLEANGCNTRTLTDITEVAKHTRIVTEPQYFSHLKPDHYNDCLLVGNKNALKDLPVLTLSRPLTEDKIESAISQFLKR